MRKGLRSFLAILGRLPVIWRWAGLVALLVILGFAGWFFFLRPSSPVGPGQQSNPPPRPALGKTVSYGDYMAAVDRSLGEVRNARAATSSGERKTATGRAIDALGAVEGASVTGQGAGAVPSQVDNTLVLAELRRDNSDLGAVEDALSTLSQTLHSPPGQVAGTLPGDRATGELRQVLSDPIFDYEAHLSPLQRLARWLAQFTGEADPSDTLWRWVLSVVAGIAGGIIAYMASERLSNRWARIGVALVVGVITGLIAYFGLRFLDITGYALGVAGLIVALVAIWLVLRGLNVASAPPAKPRAISDLAAVLGMNSTQARERAADSAAGGDFRSAVRFRCLAVLLVLDEAGKLAFDRSATNREYLFRAEGPLHDQLQPLLDRFDAAWYGNMPISEAGWRDYDARSSLVEAEVAAEQSASKGRRAA